MGQHGSRRDADHLGEGVEIGLLLGGALGKVLGYAIMIAGLFAAAAVVLLVYLIAPASAVGYVIGVPLAIISLLVGLAMLYGSHRLHRAGSEAEREARQQALYALAANRGGLLTPVDAARSLGLSVSDVDAVLSEWAKRDPDHVSLEVDEEGELFYLFSRPGQRIDTFGKRYRVEPEGRVRVVETMQADEAASESGRDRLRHRS